MRDSLGLTSEATVSVNVTGTNHAPLAAADTAVATEGGAPVTINVLANDSDTDGNAGDSLALVSINGNGLQGTATIAGGNIVYDVGSAFQSLAAGVTATDTFNYTVADSQGAESTTDVEVTVTGVNDTPVAAANTYSVSEDAGQITLDVLGNDTDADAGDTLTVVSVSAPTGFQGSVAVASGGSALTYTVGSAFQSLLSGQTATESFSYTVQDSAGAQTTAAVTLTIVGANEAVVIVNPPAPGPGAIVGTAGDDIMTGTAGADTLFGQAGDDEINAGGGADIVFGGAQNDTLVGGAGNDILSGGAGRDDLTGDVGADTFRFYVASDSTVLEFDRIRDFSLAEGDRIDLSLIDANTVLGGNNAFTFSSSFTGVAGQLVFDPVTGMLLGDVNGDSAADLMIEVRGDAPSVAGVLL
jgi:VCBS repeat-containing protein